MKYCNKCKVNVAGTREKCPLCQSNLSEVDGKESEDKFPKLKRKGSKLEFVWRLFLVLTIISIFVSAIVNYQLPSHGMWCRFVVAGVISAWVFLFVIIKKYKNILKCLFYETVIIAVFVVLWDYYTGMHGWSLDFVLPCLFTLIIFVMGLLTKILKIGAEEYIIYLASLATFGIIPGVFWMNNVLSVELPSMICVGVSFVLFFSLILFEGKNMWLEFTRRLHI